MVEKIICIIPARGGSKRFPRKNIVLLNKKPLISYTIEVALQTNLFDCIVVSTEDNEIAEISKKYNVIIDERKKYLADDKSTIIDVCLDILKKYKNFSYVCILLPTSPLRTPDDIIGAFKKLKESNANGIMAITSFSVPPFWALYEKNGFIIPYFGHEFMIKIQDLPKTFVDNGSIYIMKTEVLKNEKTHYCSNLIGFFMPRERSIDIDEKFDLKFAEFILKRD